MGWETIEPKKCVDFAHVGKNGGGIMSLGLETLEKAIPNDLQFHSGTLLIAYSVIRKGFTKTIPSSTKDAQDRINVGLFSVDLDTPYYYLERIVLLPARGGIAPITRLRDPLYKFVLKEHENDASAHYLRALETEGKGAYANYSGTSDLSKKIKPHLQELSEQETGFHNALYNADLQKRFIQD